MRIVEDVHRAGNCNDDKPNHHIGPNIAAILAVPRLCAANKPIRMKTVSGATYSLNAGLASLSPSTAESTEIAGVITESPRNIEAPMTPRRYTNAGRQRRQRQRAALSVVVGAQLQQDIFQRYSYDQRPDNQREHAEHDIACNARLVTGGHYRLAEGVKRAGADVAIDDANAAER